MLMQERPRRTGGLAVATLLSGLLLVPAGAAAMDAESAEVDAGPADPVAATATIDELRTLVEDLSLANDALSASNADLQAAVDSVSQERDRLVISGLPAEAPDPTCSVLELKISGEPRQVLGAGHVVLGEDPWKKPTRKKKPKRTKKS